MKTRHQKLIGIAGIALLIVTMTACANHEAVGQCLNGHTYGFWGGLWHGIIAPVDFVIMLFKDDVTMYAENNNGAFYALGFLIGGGGWGFLGGKGLGKRRRRRE